MKNVGNSSRGHSQGVSKIFSAPMYMAHCAVIFAIAQLSCYSNAPRHGQPVKCDPHCWRDVVVPLDLQVISRAAARSTACSRRVHGRVDEPGQDSVAVVDYNLR